MFDIYRILYRSPKNLITAKYSIITIKTDNFKLHAFFSFLGVNTTRRSYRQVLTALFVLKSKSFYPKSSHKPRCIA